MTLHTRKNELLAKYHSNVWGLTSCSWLRERHLKLPVVLHTASAEKKKKEVIDESADKMKMIKPAKAIWSSTLN